MRIEAPIWPAGAPIFLVHRDDDEPARPVKLSTQLPDYSPQAPAALEENEPEEPRRVVSLAEQLTGRRRKDPARLRGAAGQVISLSRQLADK